MSFQAALDPVCTGHSGSVALVVKPNSKDLGEFSVRRVLPAPERRMVGPFIFFDHMGPADFAPGQGIQVRPHPHIGIATITAISGLAPSVSAARWVRPPAHTMPTVHPDTRPRSRSTKTPIATSVES